MTVALTILFIVFITTLSIILARQRVLYKFLSNGIVLISSAVITVLCVFELTRIPKNATYSSLDLFAQASVVLFWFFIIFTTVCIILFCKKHNITLIR